MVLGVRGGDVDDVDVGVGDQRRHRSRGRRRRPNVVGEGAGASEAARRHRLELLAGARPQRLGEGSRDAARGEDPPAQCRSLRGSGVRGEGSVREGIDPSSGLARSSASVVPTGVGGAPGQHPEPRQRIRQSPGGGGGRGEGTASASVNGCRRAQVRGSARPPRAPAGKHAAGDAADERAQQQGLVATPPARGCRTGAASRCRPARSRRCAAGARPGRRAPARRAGGPARRRRSSAAPPGSQHPRHVGEPLAADEVGRHLALGIRIDDDGVGAVVLERCDALAPGRPGGAPGSGGRAAAGSSRRTCSVRAASGSRTICGEPGRVAWT